MMTAVLIIESLAIVLLGVLVVGLLRSHAEIIRSLHDLGTLDRRDGAQAPRPRPSLRPSSGDGSDLSGLSLSGSAVQVGVANGKEHTLLAFLSSGCMSCVALWQELGEGDPTDEMQDTRLVVVTKGPEAESRSRLEELAPGGITVIQTTEAWHDYGVPVSPYFILVDGMSGKTIGEGSATSWAQVRSLMGQALADARSEAGVGEIRADAELRKAGIGPGHPSLYPEQPPSSD
jgi:hypothetical protein